MSSAIKRALNCHCVEDFRIAAQRTLPRMLFDFLDGGAQNESTVRENRAAIDRYRLLASGPVDVHQRSTATKVFDVPIKMPLVIGPTGYAGAFWPKGDLALARAAARAGIPFVVSNGANESLEDINDAAAGRVWLQLYVSTSRARTTQLLNKAKHLGIEAIEVTVDTAVPGRRLRDLTNGFGLPLTWNCSRLLDVMRHPNWALRMLPHGTPRPGLLDYGGASGKQWTTVSEFMRSQVNPALSWEDLQWLRDQWAGRLLVKGLLDPDQVPHALAAGYDGVVVSNHGGRQLDGAVATLDVLPEFISAAAGKIPVLIDSGFRSGTDVLKALALGATAVQLGRPALYGLSVAGEAGVDRVLSVLQVELDIAMALTGISRVEQAGRRLLYPRPGTSERKIEAIAQPRFSKAAIAGAAEAR